MNDPLQTDFLDPSLPVPSFSEHPVLENFVLFAASPSDCQHDWSEAKMDMKAAGGIPIRLVSVNECRHYCVSLQSCLGIDIDENPGAYALCWVSINENVPSPYKNVKHFDIIRPYSCGGVS